MEIWVYTVVHVYKLVYRGKERLTAATSGGPQHLNFCMF